MAEIERQDQMVSAGETGEGEGHIATISGSLSNNNETIPLNDITKWRNLCKKKLKPDSTHLIVTGVVVLAIVVSIMAINWAQLIYDECESEIMVFGVLITFNSIGLICILFLIGSRSRHPRESNRTKGITFLKIKLISMYIFGVGYLFHCGFYVWKHTLSNDCGEDKEVVHILGQVHNSISIIYTFFLFVYFALFYVRKQDNTFLENAASLGILLANLCIWLDTLFSESNFLFKKQLKNDNSSAMDSVTEFSDRATETISKTDPFIAPAMIEFSLMAIDMLFTKTDGDDNIEVSIPSFSLDSSIQIGDPNEQNDKGEKRKKAFLIIGIIFQIAVSLAAFVLFAFTFTVVLTTDSSSNVLEHPEDFNVYVTIQLTMKLIMVILISICLFVKWSCLTYHFNVWAFVLIITCFGNIIYHMLYCFALHFESNKNQTNYENDVIEEFIDVSWADNIISIVLAGLETLFILGMHSPKDYVNFMCHACSRKCEQWLNKNFVHYACSLLGVLNLGIWVSDSIGEERLPVFSIAIYNAYSADVWSVINKIILPLTIFFRFHTALDFLEFYWNQKSKNDKMKLTENIPTTDSDSTAF